MSYLNKSLGIVAFVMVFCSQLAGAQDAQVPRGLSITVYQVAPGMEPAFEEVSGKFKEAADKLDGFPTYYGFSPAIGADGLYGFASPFNSFTDLSAQRNVFVEAFGEKEAERLGKVFASAVTSTSSYILVPRPDLGVANPDATGPTEIAMGIQITVKNGMQQQYADYLTKLVEASKATAPGAYWTTYQPGIGTGGVWSVRVGTTWANMDTPTKPLNDRLVEHFGKRAGERIIEDGQDCIESVEYSIQRYRADLSHIAPAA